jgi:hypothetical protein
MSAPHDILNRHTVLDIRHGVSGVMACDELQPAACCCGGGIDVAREHMGVLQPVRRRAADGRDQQKAQGLFRSFDRRNIYKLDVNGKRVFDREPYAGSRLCLDTMRTKVMKWRI